LYIINDTLLFIDDKFSTGPDASFKKQLTNKYDSLAEKLTKEIRTHRQNEDKEEDEQIPVVTVTPLLHAQIEIGKFQRELLIKLHKEGAFSDAAIKQTERNMDIDDLKFSQLLPDDK